MKDLLDHVMGKEGNAVEVETSVSSAQGFRHGSGPEGVRKAWGSDSLVGV